jgi:DNA-binding transcriptional ArsR family regulator
MSDAQNSEDEGFEPTGDAGEDAGTGSGGGMMASMQASAEAAADLLRAIGSAHRLQILCMLVEAPRTVTEICDATGMRQSLASQHLSRLRLDGLVRADRQGHFVHYSLTNPVAKEIIAILYRHFCAEAAGAALGGG